MVVSATASVDGAICEEVVPTAAELPPVPLPAVNETTKTANKAAAA